MATILQIKRSTTAGAPANDSLQPGELAYSYQTGTLYIGTADGTGAPVTLVNTGAPVYDELGMLLDVSLATPQENEVLMYNGTEWVNNDVLLSTNVGDVTVTTPADGQALVYQTGVWVNQAVANTVNGLSGAVVLDVDSLDDVVLTGLTAGQVLTYDGSNWVNQNAGAGVTSFTDLDDVPTSYTGNAGKLVAVNSGETALEFVDVIDGGTF